MLKISGKTTSINVRKVLWACEEAGLEYVQEGYGSGFASTETDAFSCHEPERDGTRATRLQHHRAGQR